MVKQRKCVYMPLHKIFAHIANSQSDESLFTSPFCGHRSTSSLKTGHALRKYVLSCVRYIQQKRGELCAHKPPHTQPNSLAVTLINRYTIVENISQ